MSRLWLAIARFYAAETLHFWLSYCGCSFAFIQFHYSLHTTQRASWFRCCIFSGINGDTTSAFTRADAVFLVFSISVLFCLNLVALSLCARRGAVRCCCAGKVSSTSHVGMQSCVAVRALPPGAVHINNTQICATCFFVSFHGIHSI